MNLVPDWLIDVIKCPKCRSSFRIESIVSEPIGKKGHFDLIEGNLVCAGCGASFRVENGIPIFVCI